MDYQAFLASKRRVIAPIGPARAPALPPTLFDWQQAIVRWAVRKGRAAIFADCGLGKSFMQIAWAKALNVPTIYFAPLCVAEQTVLEAEKLSIPLKYCADKSEVGRAKMVITNYERLGKFDLSRFQAVVLDESSILKSFTGATRSALIAACADVKFRLCCTATPSPNDIAELANHAEFLGLMTRQEFLATWFIHDDQGWRMKGHAVQPFYRWLASWAVALRSPSDLGYDASGFTLPPLHIHDQIVESGENLTGALFPEAGLKGIQGRLSARRGSLTDRVAATAALVAAEPHEQWMIWCGLNEESSALADAIPGSVEVSGDDSYSEKIAAVQGFISGKIRYLISKGKILGFGMNFQHCARTACVGMSDSYEMYYQMLRRLWRFGQQRPVHCWIVVSDAERMVVENVRRKETAAASLADGLLQHVREFEREELSA
jgi:superfamily II DNA or RNA helicase